MVKKPADHTLLEGQTIALQGVYVLEEDEHMTRYLNMADMKEVLESFGAKVGSLTSNADLVTTLIFGDEERTAGHAQWEGSKKKKAYEKEVKNRKDQGNAKEIEVFESLDDFLVAYKESGLLDAMEKAAHIADFRQQKDKEGKLKEIVEPGAARTMNMLGAHKVGAPGLAKLPKV